MVRQWLIGTLLAVLAAPALAQDTSESVDEGFNLLREGARILMESMLKEMEPTLRDMQEDFGTVLKEMEPALRDLGAMIGDLRNYHPPVKLPNGDIIIRRKTPAEILTERGREIEL
jgi:hypothetical protein